ncbi:hypothetical protein AMTRI_Chr09g17350 [Amborella trichopoda]|uniref:Plastid lipid-associated protein/fibrillin conserved domain-containing protein n=1 Tax=Amborella trichopoda TaxID=13333 RepID=W1PM35_AMBTC|nr:probable plastid-lipid-associated protein 10, chloroplastic [Amborella trichopoda]XP_020524248.1 probable plastid-lipid-associated protein 10, chloroplastic [Amborella trichopoda]ERN08190.1 hypothetical protein AMTR_s00018p00173670 [Amborella trichopoda]|eukprot:XP_006846515.1 probable plastid-lipid-associated protein 10, chloroplastic [Amborella trichopoda]
MDCCCVVSSSSFVFARTTRSWGHRHRPTTISSSLIGRQEGNFFCVRIITSCSTAGRHGYRFTQIAKRQRLPSFKCVATNPTTVRNVEKSKFDLLTAVQDTQRGLVATPDQRAQIEEILVSVEGFDAGSPIDLPQLDGTWRLQYTSASDVLVLLESAKLPFLQVGQIFQKFECRDRNDGGIVRNVVRWSISGVFEKNEGATLLVTANFSVVSTRNIHLRFEEVGVEDIRISEELQALIAPAFLPRTYFTFEVLQFIRSFKAQIPLSSPDRRSVGGLYYLSYLDRDMLLGRALGGGGVFVFTRAQPHTL